MFVRSPTFSCLAVLLALGSACGSSEQAQPEPPAPAPLPAVATPVPPAPPAPQISPEVAASQKAGAMASCMNRYGESVRRVRQSYLERIEIPRNPDPARIQPSIFNWITSDPGSIQSCRQAIDAAIAQAPTLEDLDAAAATWMTALEAIFRTATEAKTYYERQTFNDDHGAGVIELHTKLLAGFDAFVAADEAIDRVVHGIERRGVAARLAELERDPSKHGEFLVERTHACTMTVTDLVTSLELRAEGRKRHFVSTDAAGMMTAVTDCQRFVDEMVASPELARIDTGGSYGRDAQSFVAASLILARAVRDDAVQASESDAQRLKNAVLEAYNSMIGDYNRF